MGFFDDMGRALGGAASGVAGGPLGIIGGGIAGLLSGGGGAQESTVTQPTPRAWTPEEQAALERAYGGLEMYGNVMTPEQREAMIADYTSSYFNPMSRQIDTGLTKGQGSARAAHGRGGMLGSSKAQADNRQMVLDATDAKASAYAQARGAGEQSFFGREQDRRSNLATSQGLISMLHNNRLSDSGMSRTHTYPDMFANDMVQGFGQQAGNPSDWYNGANQWISDQVGGLFNRDQPDPMDWDQNKKTSGPIAWR